MGLKSLGGKFLFVCILFFQLNALAAPKAVSSQGPALVQPPDVLMDDTAEAPALEPMKPTTRQENEPLPLIKRKKENVDSHYHPESRYIEHPNAEKGLIKIDKERIYHYKVKASEQKHAGSFRIGVFEPLNLTNPDDSRLTFDDMYDQRDFPFLLYDHEWQFFQKFGKLAWKLGGGLYLAHGNGQFKKSNPDPNPPREKFTLFVFPLNVGLTYRLQYWRNQWIVPYVEGAGDAFVFGETRDDGLNPTLGAKFGLAPAAHFSGGIAIALGKDARSFLDLDREYGINAVYLSAEYRNYIALSNKYDFSGDAITGGFTAEF